MSAICSGWATRTISLLPSVRCIDGGNRTNETQDVVALGRFSREGHRTVQQLYNNLAANVGVSEVYLVVEGLDAQKGEVPFFMYDAVVMTDAEQAAGDEPEARDGTDVPEESEATGRIAANIAVVDHAAGEMSTGARQVSTSALELSRLAEQLQAVATRFKV